jgi:UDP-glucose 4-epimerase
VQAAKAKKWKTGKLTPVFLYVIIYVENYKRSVYMKNIIIGSEGYIGSHLKKLMDADTMDKDGAPTFLVDIRKHFELDHVYDNVVFLAALVNVGESNSNPFNYLDTNIAGLIHTLHTVKTKHFIFASSGTASKPDSIYGLSKNMGEKIVEDYCKKHGIAYTIFRFYNVIGNAYNIQPTNKDGLFYNLIKAVDTKTFNIYGYDYNTPDGTAIRDYIHVMEVCNSIVKSLDNPSNSIESLGTGKGYSVLEITKKFMEVNNVEFHIEFKGRRDGDLEKTVLDNPSTYYEKIYSLDRLLKI